MKRRSLGNALSLILALAFLVCQRATWIHAQQSGRQQIGTARPGAQRMISTKAGFINRIRGRVFIERGHQEPEPVLPGAQMADGDQLSTAAESRVEVLINPKAYLRLDEQTQVRALSTVLTQARFELLHGTVMVETEDLSKDLAFEIVTPQGTLTISKPGVCRISLQPSAVSVDVLEGEIALGMRQQAASKGAPKFGSGKRVELKKGEAPAVTALERKPYDQFDRWSFQIAKYGLIGRLEAGVYVVCRGQQPPQLCPVFSGFQLKEDDWLLTNFDSYTELRINRGVFLSVNEQSKLHAVKSENEDTVFELIQGAVIVGAAASSQMRPLKLITPQGTFMLERGCLARFDVKASETVASVHEGRVRLEDADGFAGKGITEISHGKRLQLTRRAAASQQAAEFKAVELKLDALDDFDRWSFHVWSAGRISRVEGKMVLERKGGTQLQLDKYPPYQLQLLEGNRLITAVGGRAAVWLNSRTTLYVNEESEIRALETDVLAPRFEVLRGSAIVQIRSGDFIHKKLGIEISTPHGTATISADGKYRFDTDQAGTTIKVYSGALLLGAGEEVRAKTALKIKESEVASLTSTTRSPQISKLAAMPSDAFDNWSKLFRW